MERKRLPKKQKIFLLTLIAIIAISILFTSFSKTVKEDIYKEFTCTCCETSLLDTQDSCLMAKGMKSLIDDSTLKYFFNKEKIIKNSVMKFGIPALVERESKIKYGMELLNDTKNNFPSIQIEPNFVDLGELSNTNGVVIVDFSLKNNGTEDLIIYDLKTSCSCLTVSFIKDGQESLRGGRFSYPDGWNYIIKPNENVILRAFYDPRVTNWQLGSVERIITITSNDPVFFQRTARIAARLVP